MVRTFFLLNPQTGLRCLTALLNPVLTVNQFKKRSKWIT